MIKIMADEYGRVKAFLTRKSLLTGDEKNILVGFSGGADSVCLLFMFKRLKEEGFFPGDLLAAHLNHGIRGDEAKRDEDFVKDFCAREGIELVCKCVDIPALAQADGIGEEAAGRRERYAFFREELCRRGGGVTATAHHKNDLAETVLMNIARGSGISGLAGIKAKAGDVIRPLLCLTRDQIEAFNRKEKLDFVNDSTNLDNIYLRNYVRNELIPRFEYVNAGFTQHLSGLSEIAQRADEYLKSEAEAYFCKCNKKGNSIEFQATEVSELSDIVREYLYRRIFSEFYEGGRDLSSERMQEIDGLVSAAAVGERSGKVIELPHGVNVRAFGASVVFSVYEQDARKPATKPVKLLDEDMRSALEKGEKVECSFGEMVFCLKLTEKFIKNDDSAYTKYFDYDTIGDNVCLRMPETTDYVVVSADGKKHSLKQELKNRKVPAAERDRVVILAAGDECLWAVGVRRGMSCPAKEGGRVLEVKAHPQGLSF